MKTKLECKVGSYTPSFFVPESKGAADGEWVKIDGDDPDEADTARVAKHLGITPAAVKAIAGCLCDLRNAAEEDLMDLYREMQEK